MMYKVRNKRNGKEDVWTEEDLANAKANGLIQRFTIVGKVEEKKTEVPADMITFIAEVEKIAPGFIPDEPEVKPKRKYTPKKKTDGRENATVEPTDEGSQQDG